MAKTKKKAWYVYILLCKNKALYTGITTDLERRFLEHSSGRGAKYTRAAVANKIVYTKKLKNRSQATKLEMKIKGLTRVQKQALFM